MKASFGPRFDAVLVTNKSTFRLSFHAKSVTMKATSILLDVHFMGCNHACPLLAALDHTLSSTVTMRLPRHTHEISVSLIQ